MKTKRSMSKLKTIILIVETDDGVCYQALLSKKQDSAIRSVIVALGETLKLREDPLSLTIDDPAAPPQREKGA